MNNKELLEGFEDAEVMAAVDEIAKNPEKALEYEHNKKVRHLFVTNAVLVPVFPCTICLSVLAFGAGLIHSALARRERV